MDFPPLPQQRKAIEAPLGPVLVVAGPGAGKTFCLIGRVGYLLERHQFAPARICAVTFTNKAAGEIAARLHRSLGEQVETVTRGTLHALCLAILREHASAAGLRPGFGVADEEYQLIVLRRLGVRRGGEQQRRRLLTLFGRRRLQHYRLPAAEEQQFRDYQGYLAERNLLDFDDLIARTGELFRRQTEIADVVAARWDYLLVDEFQDLNPVQYEILKRLAAPHRNFFAVGDDEQSIFSWTGADPRVLAEFQRDFGVAAPIVLDRNCRCSHQIFGTARRLLAENPHLFDKQLSAERESPYEVRGYGFSDEEAEAGWLLDDLRADRATAGLGWGDYAILYRGHRVGAHLEGRLLRAGIPCRLARGRSITEDDVVGYVIAALRVMRDPGDAVSLEAFAKLVFPGPLLQEVQSRIGGTTDVVGAIRTLARGRPAAEPDTKKLWRFVYQVENLAALARSHHTLHSLVDELLSQSVGPYRNVLEERYDELSDPSEIPEAVELAQRLEAAVTAERDIVLAPQGGVEVALRGMLIAAGLRHLPRHPTPGGEVIASDALTLFKALQLLQAREFDAGPRRYVAFDLETTDLDTAACEIMEIGAVRVIDGEIVERYHSMIRPARPISKGSQKVTGISDADVSGAPGFRDVWPRFRAFVGDDVLVAHNGQKFDVPVLRRLAAGMGVDSLVFYDTLPLVRALLRGSAKLEDLAARFGIDTGQAHRALDDAITLAHAFNRLIAMRRVRARKSALVNLLDYLGLALAVEPGERGGERQHLLELARYYTLGRYSDALEFYASERDESAPSLDQVIEALGGRKLMAKLQTAPDPAQRYPAAVQRLRALIEGESGAGGGTDLATAIEHLLERVALSTSREADVDAHRVNLLTLHSTKGLEFSRVYVVGAEDYQLPGYYAAVDNREDEIQESRRLLYVGMTRARDRLVLTRSDARFGRESGGSRFLEEMGVEVIRPAEPTVSPARR